MTSNIKEHPNQSIEPAGRGWFCRPQFVSQWRLPPVAHAIHLTDWRSRHAPGDSKATAGPPSVS
jgi:hypothetical protein